MRFLRVFAARSCGRFEQFFRITQNYVEVSGQLLICFVCSHIVPFIVQFVDFFQSHSFDTHLSCRCIPWFKFLGAHTRMRLPSVKKIPLKFISSAWALEALARASSLLILPSLTRLNRHWLKLIM